MNDEYDPYGTEQPQLDRHAATARAEMPIPLTETGNAERFARQHKDAVRFVGGIWHVWSGKAWERDVDRVRVEALAKKTVRAIGAEAFDEKDDQRRVQLHRWAATSEKASSRAAMLTCARSEPALQASAAELDADPWAFNVENGTIDLKTGKLRPHRCSDMITVVAPVAFDESARAPRFMRFLEEILPDADTRAFVHRLLGYAMTGVIADHVMPVAVGRGANGKGVLVDAVKNVMGAYATTMPPELLMVKKFEAHPAELMTLRGRRLAVASETEKGKKLAEAVVKRLTGGDEITARGMHENHQTWRPTHKMLMLTNSKPRLAGSDNGIRRRLRIIPFDVVIPPERQDVKLGATLHAEAPGILRWLVDGCLEWQRSGLGRPLAITAATADYLDAEDVLAPFLEECCTIEEDARVKCGDLFVAYAEWAKRNMQHPISSRAVSEAMGERGIASAKTNGIRIFKGIRVSSGALSTFLSHERDIEKEYRKGGTGDPAQDDLDWGGESPQ